MKNFKTTPTKIQSSIKTKNQKLLSSSKGKIKQGKFLNLKISLLEKLDYSQNTSPLTDKEFDSGNFGPLHFVKEKNSNFKISKTTMTTDIENIENLQKLKVKRCLLEQIDGKILVLKCKHAIFGEIEIKAELRGNKPVIKLRV
ncbi:MAG: hypothetical protein ACQES9_00570, partial [Myxococcota bacterium]